jgi:hypothetical protein
MPEQVVRIGVGDTTFSAACEECGTTFAGRLDDDLEEGVFLCRFGHAIRIVRVAAEEPPATAAAVA